MIEAVIFDFDGVIGDTMHDNCVAWQKAFEKYHFKLAPDDYYRLEGMGRYQIAETIVRAHKLNAAIVEDVVETKELYYKKHNTFRIYEGVQEIFDFLSGRRISIAIVTGASRARIGAHMPTELGSKLQALITADDVSNTKPHPEPYEKAIIQLKKQPGGCLVVENAILGIESAKAAGCRCFALETTLTKNDLAIADEVLPTHAALLVRLKELINQRPFV